MTCSIQISRNPTVWNTMLLIMFFNCNYCETLDCGDDTSKRGRYYDGFSLNSDKYYHVAIYPNAFQCDSECKSTLSCTGISFDEEKKECRLFNVNGLRTQMEPKRESSVILYMPATCPSSRIGIWSEWYSVDASLESIKHRIDVGSCFIKQKRYCEALTLLCIVDFCEGDDVQYVIETAENVQSIFQIEKSGIYCISLAYRAVPIHLEVDDSGKVWVHIQKRFDGSVDFYRNWYNYTKGFGSIASEFWIGNEVIRELTKNDNMAIRFEMSDGYENKVADYTHFFLYDENVKFTLLVNGYSGNASDSFGYHNGASFTTFDNDNDVNIGNCAVQFKGGWWYRGCHRSNPNGLYLNGSTSLYAQGITWRNWRGQYFSMKKFTMKISKR